MQKLPRILLAACLGSAALLSAQTTTAPAGEGKRGGHRGGPPGHGRGGHPIVRAIDADKDGEISAVEITNAPAALRALDTNRDGNVTRDELRPARPAGAPEHAFKKRGRPADAPERPADAPTSEGGTASRRPVDPVMLALDADSDAALSAAEIANASASLSALDLDKDGKLTHDEFRPLPPAK